MDAELLWGEGRDTRQFGAEVKDAPPCSNHRQLEASVSLCQPNAQAPTSLTAEYRLHADFVWRSLQRLGVPKSDLSDALQEVFLVAHRKLGEFDGGRAKFSTWLFGIALHVASGFKRRRQPLHLDDCVLVDAQTPQSSCEERQSLELLHGALNELSPELRATFVLFELEGESCAAIATLFGVPTGTVYSRLHKARQFVKSRIEDSPSDPEGTVR